MKPIDFTPSINASTIIASCGNAFSTEKKLKNHNSTELNPGPKEERQNCLLGDPSDSFSYFCKSNYEKWPSLKYIVS